jgi:outer membrane protein assembly factor BamE (lipoprotein component of BamABCDE complex)
MKIIKKSILVVISLFLITLLSCQPRITKHGNFFNTENIQLMQKTKLSKSEVIEIFGKPSIKSTFSDDVWYYITLTQHEKSYFEIKNLENKILVITFDENKLVKKHKILTADDSSEVNISYNEEAYNNNSDTSLIKEFFSIFTRTLDAPKN